MEKRYLSSMELKTINLEDYGRRIFASSGPSDLDTILVELSGWFAYFSEQFIELEVEEAKFFEKMKKPNDEKPLSDKMIESLWKISEDGSKHVRVKQTLKTLEKLMSNLRTSIRNSEVELRNQ